MCRPHRMQPKVFGVVLPNIVSMGLSHVNNAAAVPMRFLLPAFQDFSDLGKFLRSHYIDSHRHTQYSINTLIQRSVKNKASPGTDFTS